MQKRFLLFLCVLLCLCLLPAGVFAEELSRVVDAHLTHPVDLCVREGEVFVADNLDTTAILHKFTDDNHARVSVEGSIRSLACGGGKLFAATESALLVLDATTLQTLFTFPLKNVSVLETGDFDYVDTTQTPSQIVLKEQVFVVTGNKILYLPIEQITSETDWEKVPKKEVSGNVKAVNAAGGKLYAVYGSEMTIYATGSDSHMADVQASALFHFDETEYLFYEGNLNGTPISAAGEVKTVLFTEKNVFYAIVDNMIKRYRLTAGEFVADDFSIGTNEIKADLPLDVDSAKPRAEQLRVAKATGYPSNILFEASKAEAEDRLPYCVLSDDQPFLILNYGTEDSHYFVMMNGKVGFIEKDDASLEIAENTPFANGQQHYQTFDPRVRLYRLPVKNDRYLAATLQQKYTHLTAVTAIPSFEGETWYYVSFDNNGTTDYAFVNRTDVKRYLPDSGLQHRERANPTLAHGLFVYETMSEEDIVLAEVRSGTEVTVTGSEGEWSKVQITVDGVQIVGYVRTEYLVRDGLTRYETGGLVCVLLVLAMVIGGVIWFRLALPKTTATLVIDKDRKLDSSQLTLDFPENEKHDE